MNKKGGDYIISWIPKIIAIAIIFLAVVLYVNRFIYTKLDIQDIEASLLVDRMIYSKNCFSYYDRELGRPYPGIVDYTRFSSDILDSCMYYGVDEEGNSMNRYTSAKLILTYYENGKEESATIFHNKDWYENWLPLEGIRGPGGTYSHKESNYVLIKKNDELLRGKLEFDVILPNS